MNKQLIAALLGAAMACASATPSAHGQEPAWDRFNLQNTKMAALQPSWMGPLTESDPRLSQAARLSVSKSVAPGERIISYGNNHGISLIAGTRCQFDVNPPSFFRNHGAQFPDGWGNASTQAKYRMASGDADHGNFAVTAILVYGFAARAYQNGMLTDYYVPRLAAGKAFGRFNVQSTINGVLPTGKIDRQGRTVEWNVTGQIHATSRTWFDIENNAAFNFAGPNDGTTQNFITPAAFFMVKRQSWGPKHPLAVFDGGMQIATSSFHTYNHNLITEMRIVF